MAVEENERRHQQEEKAQARKRHREDSLTMKRRSFCTSDLKYENTEGDGEIVDLILGDIRSGFPQQLGEKHFKGPKFRKASLDSGQEMWGMNGQYRRNTSVESLASSPRVLRRRISSLAGDTCDSLDSPDDTPNSTLRRRRSRLSSEDQDDNLIDFLRQSAEQEERDRRSWSSSMDEGSLDRSLLRRSSRSGRKQDLLSTEYNRERPVSPSVDRLYYGMEATASKTISEVEENNKETPKILRRKIEDWLQENEKEEAMDQKLMEKLVQRRRNELESKDLLFPQDTKRGLETLHEAKSDSEVYRKHGSLPKIESIKVDCTSQHVKDKSKWRKSTLNVANSTEPAIDERRRSRAKKNSTDILEARNLFNSTNADGGVSECNILDEDYYETRKEESVTKANEEKLNNSIGRLQSNKTTVNVPETSKVVDVGVITADDRTISQGNIVGIEQQDQTETGKRRSSKKETEHKQMVLESKVVPSKEMLARDDLEEGIFNRFSVIRKTTRRPKGRPKASDNKPESIGNELEYSKTDSSMMLQSPIVTNIIHLPQNVPDVQKHVETPNQLQACDTENTTSVVKLKDSPETKKKEKPSLRARLAKRLHSLTENLKTTTKVNENLVVSDAVATPIDQEDIFRLQKTSAFEVLKTDLSLDHPSCNDRSDLPTTSDSVSSITSSSLETVDASPNSKRKSIEEHEKDEGFEESQSLLSETYSQGNWSSCGNETDSLGSPSISPKHTEEHASQGKEHVTTKSLRNKQTLIPNSVQSHRRKAVEAQKADFSQNNRTVRVPLRKESSIPSRIGASKPGKLQSATTKPQGNRRSSKTSVNSERPPVGRQPRIIKSPTAESEPKVSGGRIVKPVRGNQMVVRPPGSSPVRSTPATRNTTVKDSSEILNKPVKRPTGGSQNVSRVPVPERTKMNIKSTMSSKTPQLMDRTVNNSFGFMKATSSSSAKTQLSKPQGEIQKVRIQALNMVPTRSQRPQPNSIRSGGLK